VTYDSTLKREQVCIYLGWRQADAAIVVRTDYMRGPVGPLVAPQLSIGHVPSMVRSSAPDRSFRGILDEIRVFGSPRDGSGALPAPEIVRIQNRGATP